MELINKKIKTNKQTQKIETIKWFNNNDLIINDTLIINMWAINKQTTNYILKNADNNKNGYIVDFNFLLEYLKRNYKLAL